MTLSERAPTARKRRFSAVFALSLLSSVSIAGKAWARKPFHSPGVSQAMCAVNYNVSGNIPYRGGAVVANVEAIPVFWSASVDPSIQAWAQGYLATLTDSAYMDLLAEYSTTGQARGTNQTIGHGTAGPAVVITPSVRGTTVSDSNGQIATELEAQITAGHLQAPSKDAQGNPNTIYVVFFPPGTVVNDGTGNSCSAFCAYHGSGGRTNDILYAVIPDMGPGSPCNKGCSDACTTDDVGVSIGSVSHELAEAISDPVNGWFNPTSRNGSEIGDICSSTSGMQTDTGIVPGTNIKAQYEWSQRNQRCLLAPIGYDGGTPVPGDAGIARDAAAQADAHSVPDAGARPDASSTHDGAAPTGSGGSGGVGAGGGTNGGSGGGTTGSGGGASGGPGIGGSAGNGPGTTGVGGMMGTGGAPASGAGGAAQGGSQATGTGGNVSGGAAGSSDRPRRPPEADSAGCSCSFEHAPRGSWWALSGFILLAMRRRRRR